MDRETLSLCMILKNEEEHLENALKSYEGIYDELILGIDKSSTDRTEEIARKFTDKIYYFEWNGNFDDVRNYVSSKCSMDWIFMPDGHEYLRPESKESVIKLLKGKFDYIWLALPFVSMDPDEDNIPKIMFPRGILWRRDKGLKWQSKLHAYLDTSIEHKFLFPPIQLVHYTPKRRAEQSFKRRMDYNVSYFLDKVIKESKEPRDYYYAGATLAEAGKYKEAYECLEKGFNLAEDLLNDKENKGLVNMLGQSALNIVQVCLQMNDYILAEKWCFECMRFQPERAEPYYYLGLVYTMRNDWWKALHWFKIGESLPVPIIDGIIECEIYAWKLLEGIMVCLFNLGDIVTAKEYASKLLLIKPRNERAKKVLEMEVLNG